MALTTEFRRFENFEVLKRECNDAVDTGRKTEEISR